MSFCKHRVMDKCSKYNRPCIFSEECCEPKEEPVMTNADRIRAMNDEELAWRFSTVDKRREFLEWLRQPAGEDDHE